MTGMTSEETAGYLRHHLQLAGPIRPAVHRRRRSRSSTNPAAANPARVNQLALAALIAACAAGKSLVDEASARSAVTETNHDPQPATP